MIIDIKTITDMYNNASDDDKRKIIAELEILLVNLKTKTL